MANAEGELVSGLWIIPHFGNDGAHYIDEKAYLEANKDAREGGEFTIPCLKLMSLLRKLFPLQERFPELQDILDIAGIREWINENPCEKYEIAYGDDEGRELWQRRFKLLAIQSGMTLVWRGSITTSLPDIENVGQLLRAAEAKVMELDWPLDRLIGIDFTHRKVYDPLEMVPWGQLMKEAEEVSNTEGRISAENDIRSGPVEALRQLSGMLDCGLITQDEFDTKRSEILSRL